MTPIKLFNATAPKYMKIFMEDFPGMEPIDAWAVFGNLGHECNGFASMQEKGKKPPAGGYGWAQWTGGRRKAYFAFCAKRGLDPAEFDSNYAFLFYELKYTWEKRALDAVKRAVGLEAKVKAFENTYERAGVKSWTSRITWAKRAKEAWEKSGLQVDGDMEEPTKDIIKPDVKPVDTKQVAGGAVSCAVAGGAAWSAGMDWGLIALIGVAVGVVAVVVIRSLK